MKSLLAAVAALVLAVPAGAQGRAAPGGARPANAPAANAPAANAPAANAPAANAPAANTPAAPAAPAAQKLTVKVPTGGEYTAYVREDPAGARARLTDSAELTLPAGVDRYTVIVLDARSGYAARREVAAGAVPASVELQGTDFTLVQKVRVQATGKDGLRLARGSVTLTDGGGAAHRDDLQQTDEGVAEFELVTRGEGSVTAAADDGSSVTRPVALGLGPGEAAQTLTVSLPDATDTLPGTDSVAAPAPGAAPAPAAAPPAAAPVTPAPAAPVQPADPGGNWGGTVIGFLFLIAAIFAGYVVARNKGITIDMVLQKLGVQPDAVAPGGGSLAGANLAGAGAAPAPPPPPPPVVADPNQCPFCGQMKDAAGGCACMVAPGSAAAPAMPAAAAGAGPRLVGLAGTYMGRVFPIQGSAVIGREPTNGVALDQDTTASRRHAEITVQGAAGRIQDLGSSNGTFVNGSRVTEAALNPGDEVSIGGTRFRFEV